MVFGTVTICFCYLIFSYRYASPASEMSHVEVHPVDSHLIQDAVTYMNDTTTSTTTTASSTESSSVSSSSATSSEADKVLRAPPDSVWMELEVQKDVRRLENRTYAYMLRGEVVNRGKDSETSGKLLQQKATFDPEIFFNIILPPIIFSAGYSMKRRHFFQNFGAIFTFAIFGSIISVFVVAAVSFAFTRLMPALAFTFNGKVDFRSQVSLFASHADNVYLEADGRVLPTRLKIMWIFTWKCMF